MLNRIYLVFNQERNLEIIANKNDLKVIPFWSYCLTHRARDNTLDRRYLLSILNKKICDDIRTAFEKYRPDLSTDEMLRKLVFTPERIS